ncbi:hypothetical protein GUJ93_ZPchr0012g19054 [Zizania palustris]|uniref:Uncharacterized protein n=1 Tax=Zizania palustris TaxID=103762 RepID=A0A8J5WU04_ZIZPA|nr:hypothetical protein GUJ93_ZPchr0012g19054 [Zizania palustris]
MHPAESEASSSSGSLRHHLNRSRTEVTWYPSQGDGTTPSQLLQSSDQNVNGHPERIAIGSVDSWDEFGRTSQNYWYDSSRNGEAVSIFGSATRQQTYEPDDDHFASRELENPSGDANIYGRLEEALHEAHYSKKEAYKESTKRLTHINKYAFCSSKEEQKLVVERHIAEMETTLKEHEEELVERKYLLQVLQADREATTRARQCNKELNDIDTWLQHLKALCCIPRAGRERAMVA